MKEWRRSATTKTAVGRMIYTNKRKTKKAKNAKPPNAGNIIELAHGLANITKERAGWFRTKNVLIPWGCDYQYQVNKVITDQAVGES